MLQIMGMSIATIIEMLGATVVSEHSGTYEVDGARLGLLSVFGGELDPIQFRVSTLGALAFQQPEEMKVLGLIHIDDDFGPEDVQKAIVAHHKELHRRLDDHQDWIRSWDLKPRLMFPVPAVSCVVTVADRKLDVSISQNDTLEARKLDGTVVDADSQDTGIQSASMTRAQLDESLEQWIQRYESGADAYEDATGLVKTAQGQAMSIMSESKTGIVQTPSPAEGQKSEPDKWAPRPRRRSVRSQEGSLELSISEGEALSRDVSGDDEHIDNEQDAFFELTNFDEFEEKTAMLPHVNNADPEELADLNSASEPAKAVSPSNQFVDAQAANAVDPDVDLELQKTQIRPTPEKPSSEAASEAIEAFGSGGEPFQGDGDFKVEDTQVEMFSPFFSKEEDKKDSFMKLLSDLSSESDGESAVPGADDDRDDLSTSSVFEERDNDTGAESADLLHLSDSLDVFGSAGESEEPVQQTDAGLGSQKPNSDFQKTLMVDLESDSNRDSVSESRKDAESLDVSFSDEFPVEPKSEQNLADTGSVGSEFEAAYFEDGFDTGPRSDREIEKKADSESADAAPEDEVAFLSADGEGASAFSSGEGASGFSQSKADAALNDDDDGSVGEPPETGPSVFHASAGDDEETIPLQASPRQPGSLERLQDLVGDGIASGKTGALELDAHAFRSLVAAKTPEEENAEKAEALQKELAMVESKARELRAQIAGLTGDDSWEASSDSRGDPLGARTGKGQGRPSDGDQVLPETAPSVSARVFSGDTDRLVFERSAEETGEAPDLIGDSLLEELDGVGRVEDSHSSSGRLSEPVEGESAEGQALDDAGHASVEGGLGPSAFEPSPMESNADPQEDQTVVRQSDSGESLSSDSDSGEDGSSDSDSVEQDSGENGSSDSDSVDKDSGDSLSRDSDSGDSLSRDSDSGEKDSGDSLSSDSGSGEGDSVEKDPVDNLSSDSDSGEKDSGDSLSSDSNPGEKDASDGGFGADVNSVIVEHAPDPDGGLVGDIAGALEQALHEESSDGLGIKLEIQEDESLDGESADAIDWSGAKLEDENQPSNTLHLSDELDSLPDAIGSDGSQQSSADSSSVLVSSVGESPAASFLSEAHEPSLESGDPRFSDAEGEPQENNPPQNDSENSRSGPEGGEDPLELDELNDEDDFEILGEVESGTFDLLDMNLDEEKDSDDGQNESENLSAAELDDAEDKEADPAPASTDQALLHPSGEDAASDSAEPGAPLPDEDASWSVKRTLLVVTQVQALEKLESSLGQRITALDGTSSYQDMMAKLEAQPYSAVVFVRPKPGDEIQENLKRIAALSEKPSVIIVSQNQFFEGLEGVDRRLDLPRKTGEVVGLIVDELEQRELL
jgi:hypothetical protein